MRNPCVQQKDHQEPLPGRRQQDSTAAVLSAESASGKGVSARDLSLTSTYWLKSLGVRLGDGVRFGVFSDGVV